MKPQIDFDTERRKEAKSNFEKVMFKLMNNAIYGKTMENVRKHIDFELVSTKERIQTCVNNPNYKGCHIINEDLAGVEKTKTVSSETQGKKRLQWIRDNRKSQN